MKIDRAEIGRNTALLLVLLFLDQIVKNLVFSGWGFNGQFFDVVFVRNTGAAFGIFQGANIVLIGVSVLVLGILIHAWPENNDRIFLTLIAAGIIGNLIDRIRFGFVIDWFDLGWFPVFNVADSCISVGVLGFVLSSLLQEIYKRKKSRRKSSRKRV